MIKGTTQPRKTPYWSFSDFDLQLVLLVTCNLVSSKPPGEAPRGSLRPCSWIEPLLTAPETRPALCPNVGTSLPQAPPFLLPVSPAPAQSISPSPSRHLLKPLPGSRPSSASAHPRPEAPPSRDDVQLGSCKTSPRQAPRPDTPDTCRQRGPQTCRRAAMPLLMSPQGTLTASQERPDVPVHRLHQLMEWLLSVTGGPPGEQQRQDPTVLAGRQTPKRQRKE